MKILAPLAEEGRINTNASIRDSQAIIINAPIENVWEVLINLNEWPEWNADIQATEGDQLQVGAQFKLALGNINIVSTIRSIAPPEQLSWTGTASGIKAIHVWKLEESDGQTIVTTEESIQGWRTLFYSHQKLHSTLLNWLERLKQRVEQH